MRTVNYRDDEYILLGHSVGAYLIPLFTHKFPDKIKSNILMSPPGILHRPKGYDYETSYISK